MKREEPDFAKLVVRRTTIKGVDLLPSATRKKVANALASQLAPGVGNIDISMIELSLDLEDLGLEPAVNAALTAKPARIITRVQLEQRTEADLLGINGISYASLQKIILALAADGRRLKGCEVDLDDLVEHLDFRSHPQLYSELKKRGLGSRSALGGMDAIAMGQVHHYLRRTLANQRVYAAPLQADRTLGDVVRPDERFLTSEVHAAIADLPVADLTRLDLATALAPFGDDNQITQWVRWINSSLRYYGLPELPD